MVKSGKVTDLRITSGAGKVTDLRNTSWAENSHSQARRHTSDGLTRTSGDYEFFIVSS